MIFSLFTMYIHMKRMGNTNKLLEQGGVHLTALFIYHTDNRWHHRFNGHELGQILGNAERQGSLACYSPWGCKESDTTCQLKKNK